MPRKQRRFSIFLAAALAGLLLASCQAAQAVPGPASGTAIPTLTSAAAKPAQAVPAATAVPATTATPAASPNPADASPTAEDNGYPPSPADSAATLAPDLYAYPDPGQPAGVPAVENRARLTARIISVAADPQDASTTRLHVQVLSSTDVSGMPNMTKSLLNTETDLLAKTAGLLTLHAGDQIDTLVTVRGDEKSVLVFVLELTKK